jgi:Uma2 family endonuclease
LIGDNQPAGRTIMAVEDLQLESRPPLTVEEFKTLAEAEGWDEDTRVELLDGEVVWMSPINDPHAGCVNRLNRLFSRRYTDDVALVSVQNPIRIDNYDEPQPDVALLRPRADDYATATPTPTDILLLVEVSDSTLRIDLGRKARIYADAAVAEYWVVDLKNQVLYVHRDPAAGRYATRRVLGPGERISGQFAPEVVFGVAELFG